MSRHAKPGADDLSPTVSDSTWEQVTATEQWEATPAAGSAENARWN
jgi:hypothetical protein